MFKSESCANCGSSRVNHVDAHDRLYCSKLCYADYQEQSSKQEQSVDAALVGLRVTASKRPTRQKVTYSGEASKALQDHLQNAVVYRDELLQSLEQLNATKLRKAPPSGAVNPYATVIARFHDNTQRHPLLRYVFDNPFVVNVAHVARRLSHLAMEAAKMGAGAVVLFERELPLIRDCVSIVRDLHNAKSSKQVHAMISQHHVDHVATTIVALDVEIGYLKREIAGNVARNKSRVVREGGSAVPKPKAKRGERTYERVQKELYSTNEELAQFQAELRTVQETKAALMGKRAELLERQGNQPSALTDSVAVDIRALTARIGTLKKMVRARELKADELASELESLT